MFSFLFVLSRKPASAGSRKNLGGVVRRVLIFLTDDNSYYIEFCHW